MSDSEKLRKFTAGEFILLWRACIIVLLFLIDDDGSNKGGRLKHRRYIRSISVLSLYGLDKTEDALTEKEKFEHTVV